MTEKLLSRFLSYVQYNTQSSEESTTFPSTATQLDFAKILCEECKTLGLQDVSVDEYGYVMATLPATTEKEIPTIGFIAHMDTAPDYSGNNVKPSVLNYQGGDIVLNEKEHVLLKPSDFSILNHLKGEKLIVTDGTTLLGADDKCGIAEIMTAMEYFLAHPEIPHGTIKICFTPDEEVGAGADHFNVERFNAQFAYTIDGGALGELEAENFNAAGAKVIINGSNIHPGYAKDKMINSMTLATLFHQMLPQNEVPEYTSGYDGFFHLTGFNGTVEQTTLSYIIRDFDKESFEERKTLLKSLVQKMNAEHGAQTVTLTLKDQYLNMHEIIKDYPQTIALAEKAMNALNITPKKVPIRGGTDGARLSFMGLPCPNLFTGGYNFHSKYEFAVVSHMEQAMNTIIKIIELNDSTL